jgi:hypothetical protein
MNFLTLACLDGRTRFRTSGLKRQLENHLFGILSEREKRAHI